MNQVYWHKQTEQPLFPDLLWARPETKQAAGKLLIVGGNAHSFATPATAYTAANSAGIGSTRVLLPDTLHKTLRNVFPEAEYAPSTPSGSFARRSLAELLAASAWAEGVLLAGDIGKNSETTATLESFITKYQGLLTVVADAADAVIQQHTAVLGRKATLLVLPLPQLQALTVQLRSPYAFTMSMSLTNYVEHLHQLTTDHPSLFVMTPHATTWLVAVHGEVSSTPTHPGESSGVIETAAIAATWWLQNPTEPFAALTTSLLARGGNE